MKVYRVFEKVLLLVLLCLCSWTSVLAQQSGSAASVSRRRAIVNSGLYNPPPATTYHPTSPSVPTYSSAAPVFKIPDEIAVEEFVNYRKHRLPLPKYGHAVALDTRWGNSEISRSQREAILQIGFTTAEVNERTDLRPLNLVGKTVQVTIEYGAGLHLQKIYGYTPRYGNNSVSITLDDMNNGLTQVVMAKFRVDSIKDALPVKVRLSYYDVKRRCVIEEAQALRLVPDEDGSCDLLADVEVKKNYTIAELADSLFEMTGLARRGSYSQAQSVLDTSVATAYRRYPNMEDEDIRFILGIVEGYRRDLKVYNEHSRKFDCGNCR
jgi:hypothetical protein